MKELISKCLKRSIEIREAILSDTVLVDRIAESARLLEDTVHASGVIYSCGNGGSSCDAMHLTEELVARYKKERPGIKAMHFMDPGTMTCWGNDYSFEDIFKRNAETFCSKGDALVAISTSGNSKNVISAVKVAQAKGTKVIGLLGKDGGLLKDLVDCPIVVPASETERIQEVHITIIHLWCEFLEKGF